jgi:hypothetical protein
VIVDLIDRYIEVGAKLKRTTIYKNYKNKIARMIKEGYSYDDILVWLKSELKKRDIELDAELTRASLYQWIRRSISDKDIEQAVVTDDEVAVAKKTTDSKVSIFKNLIK